MFFFLYWHFLAIPICAVITYKLLQQYLKGQKVALFTQSETELKTTDQVAAVKENDDANSEEEEEGEEWTPSLENVEHVPLIFNALSVEESLSRSRAYYEFMNKRRTVRSFSDKDVPIEILYNCIRTAGTSPSGAHTEPWTFVLIKSMETKQQVRAIIEEEEEINYRKRMGKVWTGDLKPFRTNWVKEYLTEAPYLILMFKQTHSYRASDGRKKLHYYNEQSICIAAGLLLSAIHDAGLVSLTSTPLNCGPALRALLGRPKNEKLTLLLPVGYPKDGCMVPGIERKHLEDILVEF